MIERCLVSKPDAADGSWLAESNTRLVREKQGGLIVPIHLPIKPHTHHPVSNGGVLYCPKPCQPVRASCTVASTVSGY